MDDLISRQAAINTAQVMYKRCDENIEDYRDLMVESIKVLPSAQPEQQWIPCSERLPSKADHIDNMVLVCFVNGSVRFNTYMNGWVQGNPVAWMPLPEPYKGEQE